MDYYEYNNGYYFKLFEFDYDYAGNRMINVYRALEDLNMLGGANNEWKNIWCAFWKI